jgi:CspA family cold shock protein
MSIQRTVTRGATVTAFDEPVGLGELTEPDGTLHPFHCTAIADGSRDIAVGTEVTFRLVAARAGRFEASDVRPVT